MIMMKLSRSLYVNIAHITVVEKNPHGGTIICTQDGKMWEVEDNVEDVIEHIDSLLSGLVRE